MTETGGLGELDLTPHDPGASRSGGRRRPAIRNVLILSVLAAAMGFVLFQALSSARVFFYNVDEAIERREELGDSTFRMQGTVVTEEEVAADGALVFTVAFGGETAEIRHVGDEPSGLFDLDEKVVVEGHWEGEGDQAVFRSHQILVKHSEEYVEDNPDRVDYELDPGPVE